MITLAIVAGLMQAYRCIFVAVFGILAQSSVDVKLGFQGTLQVNKHIVIPLNDFVTGVGLLYLFFCLAKKTEAMAKLKTPMIVNKRRANYDTTEIKDLLLMQTENVPPVQSMTEESYSVLKFSSISKHSPKAGAHVFEFKHQEFGSP